MRRAAHDYRMAALVFVSIQSRPGIRTGPCIWRVQPKLAAERLNDAIRNPDVGYRDFPGMNSSRHQKMRGLHPAERDCMGCTDGVPLPLSAHAIDPAREIDRQDRRACRVDRLDCTLRFAGEITRKTRAEQRVDDEIASCQIPRIERFDLAPPARCRDRRVAVELLARTEQREPHIETLLAEYPCSDKAVAAVVPGTARHRDPAAIANDIHCNTRNCGARPLHQVDAGSAGRNREPVCFRHLLRRQNLMHVQAISRAPVA